jgi:hypothetical protein
MRLADRRHQPRRRACTDAREPLVVPVPAADHRPDRGSPRHTDRRHATHRHAPSRAGAPRLALLLLLAACRAPGATGAPAPDVGAGSAGADTALRRLYDERQLFALRDSVVARGGLPRGDAPDFYAGAVAAAFGLTDEAQRTLGAYLDRARAGRLGADTARVADAEELLAEQAARAGRYAEAAQRLARVTRPERREQADTGDAADRGRARALWSALAAVPPQRVALAAPTTVPIARDRAGLLTVPVRGADTAAMSLVFDTGAGLSVATASTAARLGIRLLPDSTDVRSITGALVRAGLGLAPRLTIGAAELRDVLFLVFRDADLAFPQVGYQIHGIVGYPVIAALGAVTITRGALAIAPRAGAAAGGGWADLRARNVALDGFTPLVEARFGGRAAAYAFDTGAQTTMLYPPFLARHDSLVRASGERAERGLGGAGGSTRLTAYRLRDARLTLGGRELTLPAVDVMATAPNPRARRIFGNLGLDLLARVEHVTIDLERRRVEVR